METSQEINEIAGALALAQAEIETASKDRVNPHFKSAYATLASVWEACRGPITKHGLSVAQDAKAEGAQVTVTTMLLHKSGQWFRGNITMRAANDTPQSIGSAITYGRRYALAALVGVAPDDDDGNAGSGQGAGQRPNEDRGTGEAQPPGEYRNQRYQDTAPSQDYQPGTAVEWDSPVRARVKDIRSKSGPKKDGTSYTRYGIETEAHGFFNTFDAALADIALDAQKAGKDVAISFRTNGRWKDIEAIRIVSDQPSPVNVPEEALPF